MVDDILQYLLEAPLLEIIGLIAGLLAVYLLVIENIWTWPTGIIYCLVSFVIFWQAKLYQDFLLTGFFLAMNIYGWHAWLNPIAERNKKGELPISRSSGKLLIYIGIISLILIFFSGSIFWRFTDAALPYWDASTTVLSLSAMWMTTQKKIENWIVWFIVDVIATGIYAYKGIYLYSILYLVYLGLAVAGYLNWKRIYRQGSSTKN